MTGAIFFMLLGASTVASFMACDPIYFHIRKNEKDGFALAMALVPVSLHIAMILTILLRHK